MRVSGAVTPIFVPPVEMPAPCHVRLGGTTLKFCESFAVCRTRLFLPYILRSTSLLRRHDKGTPDAKVAEQMQNGRTELQAVVLNGLQQFRVVHRARQAFHSGEQAFRQASLGVAVGNEVLAHLS